MNKLVVYCGQWKKIPTEIKQSVVIVSQVYETGKEMSQKGKDYIYDSLDFNGWDNRIFCNNDSVFNGMRVAVKEIGLKASDHLSFIYYDEKGIAHQIKLEADGNLAYGVPLGFFDQSSIDLLELF